MAGERATEYIDLIYQPGVVTNLTDRDAKGRYKDSNRIRWHKGLPEKIGGWVRQSLTGANGGTYIGVARALHDWSSLDTQQWIAVGTNCKLYLVNNGVLYDITPMRRSENLTNPLSVTLGSPTITITDDDHRVADGDHITIIGALSIGGFDVNGTYDVASVIDENRYTVTYPGNFNLTQVGGGALTIEYDVGCGLEQNGELLGWGTGEFGEGTWGTPRPVGSGVPARMRVWSLSNWGEDLVASPSDGALYWWDRSLGPFTRARLIENAPDGIQRILVNPENRHLIALGCTGIDGVYDPMRIRWCSQEDLNTWLPARTNTAGGRRLDYGSRIVTGVVSRSTNYVWSDTMLYSLSYAPPGDFIPNPLGTCKIVGPNAMVDVNGVVYFMVFDDFMVYDGTLRVIPCEVHTKIFGDEDRNIEGVFDRRQAEGAYCASYTAKNEVTWFFPGVDETTWYVTFNYTPGSECWYYGQMERTAYHDVSEAITGYKTNPYGANGGFLYKHEVGTDEVEGDSTTIQNWFLETYDNTIGGSDRVFLINGLIPNFDRFEGSMNVILKKKARPRQRDYQERGPYAIDEETVEKGVRCKASQVAIRWESDGSPDVDFRFGVWQILGTPYGGRVGVHRVPLVRGAPPVLSGEVLISEDLGSFALAWTEGVPATFPLTGPYELQLSFNGVDWTTVATVPNGDPREYDEPTPTEATDYMYRVKVTDSEGNNTDPEWSNIVTLNWEVLEEPVYLIGTFVDNNNLQFVTGSFNLDLPYTPANDGNPDRMIVVEIQMSDQGISLGTPRFGGQLLTLAGTQNHTASGFVHRYFVYYRKLDGSESGNTLRFPISGGGEANISFRATTYGNAATPIVAAASAETTNVNTVALGTNVNGVGLDGAMLILAGNMVGAKAWVPLQLDVDTPGVTYTETDYPTISANVLTETRATLNSATGRLAMKNINNEDVDEPTWTGVRDGETLPVWLTQVAFIIPRV